MNKSQKNLKKSLITKSFFKLISGLIGITVLIGLPFLRPSSAIAQSYADWNISSYDTQIDIQKDSTINVTEKIVADFSKSPGVHHGIFRYIPVDYRDDYGNKVAINLSNVKITDENGDERPYTKSREGAYIMYKIGDPDITLDQKTTYNISYKVDHAALYFKDHDEIYWNPTGDKWESEILSASATINLPQDLTADELKNVKSICYTGTLGSKEQDCKTTIQNRTVTVTSSKTFIPGEGLTFSVSLPKGILKEPTATQKLIYFLSNNWGYFLPFITFAILFYLWYTRGRDRTNGLKTTIMPYYEAPDKLSPSEIGTILDETADIHDITATIVDLAVRGYLKIIELKEKKLLFDSTDYELELLKDFHTDNTLLAHELAVLNAVFDNENKIKLSSLKNKFYQFLPGIKDKIYSEVVTKGYFPVSPDKVRKIYFGVGFGLIAIGFFSTIYGGVFSSISAPIGLTISGILCLGFSKFMPIKTKKGVETFYKIKGLEEYISTAETDRIKWQEKENIFEKLLPYAMAFGVAERWSKAFEGIYKTPPSWYQSSNPNFMNNFSTYYFVNSLNSFSSRMEQTLASAPRSSGSGGFGGGGFSGGGFGGGGGGAW